jgi:hypothetical protein
MSRERLPLNFPVITQYHGGGKFTVVGQGGLEDEITFFYALIGWSINTWAHIDRAHFECTVAALGADEIKAAIAYYRLINTSERFALTRELMDVTAMSLDMHREWRALCKEVAEELPLRNVLAHQPAVLGVAASNDPAGPAGLRIDYSTYVTTEKKQLLRPEGKKERSVGLDELREHAYHVADLSARLSRFVTQLKAIPPTVLRSSQPPFADPRDLYRDNTPFRKALNKLLERLRRVSRLKERQENS